MKKLALFLISFFFAFSSVSADNKTDLINKIESLQSNFQTLKTSQISDLRETVVDLKSSYDSILEKLWYNSETINYLRNLGDFAWNFVENMSLDYTDLNNQITTKINSASLDLTNIKDDIELNYSSISESQKSILEPKINAIESTYNRLKEDIEEDVDEFQDEHEWKLSTERDRIKEIAKDSKDSISEISTFSDDFEEFDATMADFTKEYVRFKDTYLTYLWDINYTISSKSDEYTNTLEEALDNIFEANKKVYPSLSNSDLELTNYKKTLLTEFRVSLDDYIEKNYFVLNSDSDIANIVQKHKEIKAKYIDSDWNINGDEVVANKWISWEVKLLTSKLKTLKTSLSSINWTQDWDKTLETIETEVENNIIDFYNSNSQDYKDRFVSRIRDKLSIVSLETKNAIVVSEIISLKYALIMMGLDWVENLDVIRDKMLSFKLYTSQFNSFDNDELNKKIRKLDAKFEKMYIEKDLSRSKFASFKRKEAKMRRDFRVQLEALKESYGEEKFDREILTNANSRIDKLLYTSASKSISNKTYHLLSILKLEIVSMN